jgi:hypothetical protein
MSIADYLTSGLGRLQAGLFQVDPNVASTMSPEQLKGARNSALLHLGLGILAGNNSGLQGGLGRGALMGLSDAENSFGQQTGQAYLLNRQKAQDAEAGQMRAMQLAQLTAPGLGKMAGGLAAAPDQGAAWQSLIGNPANQALLHAAGIDPSTVTPDKLPGLIQQMQQQAALYSQPAPMQDVGPGHTLVQDGKPIYTQPKEETFGAPQAMVIGGKPVMASVGSQGTVRPVPGASPFRVSTEGVAGTPAPQLTPDTVHNAAIDVMADPARIRQYATFGKDGQAMRVAINNEKTKILQSIGMTEPQLIRQQAIAKGQIKSTSDLVGMQNAVNAYETLAQGNGQRVIELANSVNTAGIPLINSAERLGKLASGSPDAAELMLVLHNYQVEAARIVTQPSLKGQLTDQAIKDIQTVPLRT